MKKLSAVFVALVPIAALACSSGDFVVGSDQSGATGEPSVDGGSCSNDNDCETGFQCAFKESDACEAKGRCFDTRNLATCAMYSAGCACDGTTVNVACQPFPSGWTGHAIAHAGECGIAADGGGAPCTTTSDCAGDQMECAFEQSEGCSAVGHCYSVAGIATCAAYSAGCACDGTEINVACTYPDGTASKPLAYPGNCALDGGEAADAH